MPLFWEKEMIISEEKISDMAEIRKTEYIFVGFGFFCAALVSGIQYLGTTPFL
jgi:hypothetical protein